MDNGCLVISLDFELMWGNLEKWTEEGYGQSNIANVRPAIKKMLQLFDEYGIHSTFATVGLLMQDNQACALKSIPDKKPTYKNMHLSPYSDSGLICILPDNEYLYFAPDVLRELKEKDNIEIATHTYCHYFCWEEGQTKEQFEEDIKTAVTVAKDKGINLKSIVFPRNNVSEEYLEVCRTNGINSYRGNPKKYFEKKSGFARKWMRFCRVVDNYLNLGNRTSYSEPEMNNGIMNIPACRMLRPYSKKMRILEPLRLRRIKKEIEYAAKHNEIYHLWWHPHNFGANMENNLMILEELLKCYAKCKDKYCMKSLTMNEVYNEYCKNGE